MLQGTLGRLPFGAAESATGLSTAAKGSLLGQKGFALASAQRGPSSAAFPSRGHNSRLAALQAAAQTVSSELDASRNLAFRRAPAPEPLQVIA